MLNNSSTKQERSSLSKAIILGAAIGGIIGVVLGFLFRYGFLAFPIVSSIFLAVSVNSLVTGAITGIVIGVIIGGLISFFSSGGRVDSGDSSVSSGKLELHEERLDITKKRVQTSEVKMHKKTHTEEQTITVPVTREELIIETNLLNEDRTETIRIPIKEERVEITKHPVILNDVSYHIEQFQENKCIEETLKKEKLKIESEGSTTVVDKEIKTPDLS